ncbi:hypothetical protein DFH08DRAFT_823676 [Mycena albidolilacea]|uniref:Uncharacterized protein n=1 Tax=Mycena albidolilacea TaxID=1033008 RepID=A0AAD6Z6Z8_9AGAR|nr:hypothetical protein DFH08DRAFT_823676 [Mycena albidolilacea]
MCCGITGTVRSDEANIVGVAGKRRELMAGLLSMLSNQLIICPSILWIGILRSTLSSSRATHNLSKAFTLVSATYPIKDWLSVAISIRTGSAATDTKMAMLWIDELFQESSPLSLRWTVFSKRNEYAFTLRAHERVLTLFSRPLLFAQGNPIAADGKEYSRFTVPIFSARAKGKHA